MATISELRAIAIRLFQEERRHKRAHIKLIKHSYKKGEQVVTQAHYNYLEHDIKNLDYTIGLVKTITDKKRLLSMIRKNL